MMAPPRWLCSLTFIPCSIENVIALHALLSLVMPSAVSAKATDDAAATSFAESTHRQYWLFSSREQLRQQRELYYTQYQQQRQQLEQPTNPSTASAATTTAEDTSQVASKKRKAPPTSLTLPEQTSLVLFYMLQIPTLAALYIPPLPLSVQSTALLFLHRFYTRHTVHQYHPKQTMCTALLLACKSEEHYVPPNRIAEKVKGITVDEMTRLEVAVLEGVGFHLRCYHPFRAARGWVEEWAGESGWEGSRRKEVEERVVALCAKSYLTECVLLYSHSHIALAALVYVNEQMKLGLDRQQMMRRVVGSDSDRPQRADIILADIHAFFHTATTIDPAAIRAAAVPIDKKLAKCRDPRFDPTTTEYAEMQAKRDEDKQRKREEKSKKRQEEEHRKMEQLLGGAEEGGFIHEGRAAMGAEGEAGEEEFVIRKRVKGESEEDRARETERERRREERTKEAVAAGATFGPTTGWP